MLHGLNQRVPEATSLRTLIRSKFSKYSHFPSRTFKQFIIGSVIFAFMLFLAYLLVFTTIVYAFA
jgi:hypothetical protein